MTKAFAQQIDHDGPQHIEGAAPPASRSEGPVLGVSKAMPPQEVMDAAMLLTEACSSWTPAPLPKTDAKGLPAAPIMHNPSYVMHQDLCSLATDPVGFNAKVNDTFANGMIVALVLMALVYVVITVASMVLKLFSRRKQRSDEILKSRLLSEINCRQTSGVAE
jgi:hypothetical protein